jgi:hypothetical protein
MYQRALVALRQANFVDLIRRAVGKAVEKAMKAVVADFFLLEPPFGGSRSAAHVIREDVKIMKRRMIYLRDIQRSLLALLAYLETRGNWDERSLSNPDETDGAAVLGRVHTIAIFGSAFQLLRTYILSLRSSTFSDGSDARSIMYLPSWNRN